MPLLSVKHVSCTTIVALWQLTEGEEELRELCERSCIQIPHTLQQMLSPKRRMESLATQLLLHHLVGTEVYNLHHDERGKPLLKGWNISLSHTRGWVAAILSRQAKVAIDVEYFSFRVHRVAAYFLRPDETFTSTEERLLAWSAKETAYKYYSEQSLKYHEMKILPFSVTEKEYLSVQNLPMNCTLKVNYTVKDDYVLTWAVEKKSASENEE